MGDQVRVDHMDGFRIFAQGMQEVKSALDPIGTHRHIDLPPGQSIPLADMTVERSQVRGAENAAVARYAAYAIEQAKAGLSGLAFVATYIATKFTETDDNGADRLRVEQLGREAEDEVPPVPQPPAGADQAFVAQVETMEERQQRLAMPAQPGLPG